MSASAEGLANQMDASLKISSDDHLQSRIAALEQRQASILKRIEDLERRVAMGGSVSGAAAAAAAAAAISSMSSVTTTLLPLEIDSPVQRKLQQELLNKGLANHRFVRAPPDYYANPLEYRLGVVGAASVHHLCKSIVMENTRVQPDEPGVIKYWLVIVQYTAKLHSDKLRTFVQSAHSGGGAPLSKSRINMRLCPEDVSATLTGYVNNAVSPIGLATSLPIIMSHRIAALAPDDQFWLGAGEVDLKVGLSAADFVKAYAPHVVDCTYE